MKQNRTVRMIALLIALVMLLALPAQAVGYDDNGNEVTVIVLDPGHGGGDPGTVATHDGQEVWESILNWKIADYCRDYLEEHYRNVRVLLTREENVRVSLEDRVAFAEENGADYVLSIHLNANNGSARGALALVPRGRYRPEQAAASKAVAEAILENLAELGLTNRGLVEETTTQMRYPDGSYADAYKIVRYCVEANIPGVIMEHAFLDSKSDYTNYLSSEEKLAALGEADALGLAEILGLEIKLPYTSAELGDTPFEDVIEGEWFYDSVTYVWEEGLMQGISETEFGPTLPANRAMVVTLLYRMDEADLWPEESSFVDVELGSWYHAPVEWALQNGITTGVSETEFAPARNVIREQFVTFLYRYAGEPEPESIPANFSDWETVSGYARNAVAWAVEIGLMTGYEDGTVRPLRELNRAELAVLMHRFHRWYLHATGVLTYEWTPSFTEMAMYVNDSFELTLTNQYGEIADVEWVPDVEGVVEINGTTVTAVGVGTVLLSTEVDGEWFDCYVEVTEEVHTWTISHEDVTIKVGESFNLRLRNEKNEVADVVWTASKSGYVTISGNKITGKAKGTVTVSCELEGQTYSCIVRVKNA